MGLGWHDIDFENATTSIRSALVAVGWKIHVSDVKTASGRRRSHIDIRTAEALRDRKTAQEKVSPDRGEFFDNRHLVFGRADGGPDHPEYITRTFDRLVVKRKLSVIRFHDIRHTHATLLLQAGVPAKVVAERLGHATPGGQVLLSRA